MLSRRGVQLRQWRRWVRRESFTVIWNHRIFYFVTTVGTIHSRLTSLSRLVRWRQSSQSSVILSDWEFIYEPECLHGLLPTKRALDRHRPRGHSFELPSCTLELHKNLLYRGACISISDRVLLLVCSWVVFEECPLGVGSLLAPSSIIVYCLLSLFTYRSIVNHLGM